MKIKKILISQPEPQSGKSPYFDIAARHGVEVYFRPFIKVEGLPAREFRQEKINLADYTGIIFTSRSAVDNYFRLCEETRVPISTNTKYFCTSEPLALYLQKYIVYRKRKIFFGLSGKLNDAQLLAAIVKNKKEKFLMPVSDIQTDDNHEADALDKAGIDYTKAVMYRTVSNDFAPDFKLDHDMLLFFSPAGIDSLRKNFPDFDQSKNGIRVGCYGKATCDAAEAAGLQLSLSAPTPSAPSMTSALDAYLKEQGE